MTVELYAPIYIESVTVELFSTECEAQINAIYLNKSSFFKTWNINLLVFYYFKFFYTLCLLIKNIFIMD